MVLIVVFTDWIYFGLCMQFVKMQMIIIHVHNK